jgi:hypothetical protein
MHVGGVSVRMELGAFMQVAKMCHLAMLALEPQVRVLAQTQSASAVTH